MAFGVSARPDVLRSVFARTGLVAALALAVLTVGRTGASAAGGTPGWYELGYHNPAGPPVLAVDGAGDDFVAYALQDTNFPGYVVYVAQRSAGSGTTVGTPVAVSGMNTGDSSLYPSIAADAAGDVIVAWYDDGVIYAATKPAGTSTFSSPVTISTPSWLADPFTGRPVIVAMDSAGDAVVVWPKTGGDGTDFDHGDILVGRMRPVGSAFATASFGSEQQIYDAAGDVNSLAPLTSVAMGGGEAVVGYSASSIAYASTWAATDTKPSSPTNLGGTFCPGASASVYCTNPYVAIDADGHAVAAFESSDQNPDDADVGVTTLLVAGTSGGAWSGPATVAAGKFGSGPTGGIAVAASPDGHDAVAWNETTGLTNTDVEDEVAVGNSPGSVGSPVAVDQTTSYLGTLGVDDNGTVLTTWTDSISSTTLEASVLPAGTTSWQSPTEPLDQGSGASQPVQLTQGDGNTVLAFAQPVNNGVGGAALVLDGFDASGPSIADLTVPSTAHTGSSVPMSVDVDDYSGVDAGNVAWNFGDGQMATGFSPNHTYATPGPYTVTVSVLDSAGFTAMDSAPITVTAQVLSASTPTITGTTKVGSTLTAHPGTWTSGTSFSYRWYASGTVITGASHSTLTLVGAQFNKTITVRVTGSKAGYTTVAKTSNPTAKVAAGTLSGPTPTITGTVKVGSLLTAHPGTWRPGTVHLGYRWYANGVAITSATHSTLTLTHAVKGKKITVKVTGTETGYRTLTKTSNPTAPVG